MNAEEFYNEVIQRLTAVKNCEYGWNKPQFVQGVDAAIRAVTEALVAIDEEEEFVYEEDYYDDDFYDGDDEFYDYVEEDEENWMDIPNGG